MAGIMDHITTKRAAEIIRCTQKHASYLAQHGYLIAEKFGRDWRIDRQSAERYAREPQQSGRPRGSRNS